MWMDRQTQRCGKPHWLIVDTVLSVYQIGIVIITCGSEM
jgi:hypothetical protein